MGGGGGVVAARLRTAIIAVALFLAGGLTPSPIFAAEDESSVGGESLILAPIAVAGGIGRRVLSFADFTDAECVNRRF